MALRRRAEREEAQAGEEAWGSLVKRRARRNISSPDVFSPATPKHAENDRISLGFREILRKLDPKGFLEIRSLNPSFGQMIK